jgi:putative methionine-R-sulfoxide reductase with GAF domain
VTDVDRSNVSPRKLSTLRLFGRIALTLLPVAAVTAMAIAAVNHGLVRAAWTAGAICATLATTILTARKDRQVAVANAAAVEAKVDLATALTAAGQPLIAALGRVASASTPEKRRTAIEVLCQKTVAIARSQCGRTTKVRSKIRSVFYEFVGNELQRREYEGRPGNVPRERFRPERGRNDQGVIELARGEEAKLFEDLDRSPPHYFSDYVGRSYKSTINVPVRVEGRSYGLLCVDSDKPNTLTDVDKGYVILLAGVLAAGLAHQNCNFHQQHGPEAATVPGQRNEGTASERETAPQGEE